MNNDVTPNSIPGMGAVTFPTDTEFGSGDMPMPIGIYNYSDYTYMMFPEDEEDDEINEKSVSDDIKSGNKNDTPEKQYIKFVREQNKVFAKWYKDKKEDYDFKIKKAKYPEDKKILKNQFELDVLKRKRILSTKIRNKRLYKAKKNLKN